MRGAGAGWNGEKVSLRGLLGFRGDTSNDGLWRRMLQFLMVMREVP